MHNYYFFTIEKMTEDWRDSQTVVCLKHFYRMKVDSSQNYMHHIIAIERQTYNLNPESHFSYTYCFEYAKE